MLKPHLAPEYEKAIQDIHNGLAKLRGFVERYGKERELYLMGQADIALLKLVNRLRDQFGWQRNPPLDSLHNDPSAAHFFEERNESGN